MRLTLALFLLALPALGQEIVPPDDALAQFTGFIVDYDDGTRELFRPDRSVTQQYPDGDCIEGVVFIAEGAMCFTYDNQPDVDHCWSVERAGDTLWVVARDSLSRFAITDLGKSPLTCPQEDLVG